LGDTPKSERWSFWIEDAIRAVRALGLTVADAPARLHDRRAVIVAERGASTITCTLVDERTGPASTEVRCRADGVPIELTLRPELVGEGFDKLLGMTVDQLVGDVEFDRVFVIAAAPRSVVGALLQSSVREKIAALPRTTEGPALRLSDGELVLRWWGEPDSDHLRAGVEVVCALATLHGQMVEGDGSFAHGPFRQGSAGDRAIDPGARASAWERFAQARRRTATVLTAAAIAGVGFLAAVITHHS
jgi:hypothetical protein